MKKWKSGMSITAAAILAVTALFGCAKDNTQEQESNSSKSKLEVEVLYTAEGLDTFREIVDEFARNNDVEVELIAPGSDYETVMKTRMASGDMPDVFVTHGWSIARYKEYLLNLNDQPWFDNISDSIKDVVTDTEGESYVLPVTQLINGITYNKDVLTKAGVDSTSIRTMDDFMAACEKIKASGVTPFYIGAKDDWTTASLLGIFSPAYYTAEGCKYPSADRLKEGTFDWEKEGRYFFADMLTMIEKGYFNEDLITADEPQAFEALATGNCAFQFGGVHIEQILKYKPDAAIGSMPVPSTSEEGKSQYAIGEGSAFGIWKDSEQVDMAKDFLAYLAEPEVANKIAVLDNQIPALKDMDTAEHTTYNAFAESEQSFEGDIDYDNLFDREYLPSGMWSVLSDSMMELFTDPTEAGVDKAAANMQTNYIEKMDVSN